MSAAQKLLDIPLLLAPSPDLPALGPTAVYEKSLEGIHAAAVESDSLLPPPPPSLSPVIPPTSSRALSGQTSKSFTKRKEPALAVPGSSASPIIAASGVHYCLSPLPASFSSHPKRPLDDGSTPPHPKRLRTMAQQHPDVLYGPVDPDGSPKAIVGAAMELIPGLHPCDVFSAKYAHSQPGVISIRFRSHDTPDCFTERLLTCKYVGVWLSSTTRDIFAKHHDEKTSKACRVACASFALDDFVGTLAHTEGKLLYLARVDPILTFAAEIVLDVAENSVNKLADA